jgi:hypothetical protein
VSLQVVAWRLRITNKRIDVTSISYFAEATMGTQQRREISTAYETSAALYAQAYNAARRDEQRADRDSDARQSVDRRSV